jgi:hypothetical protein
MKYSALIFAACMFATSALAIEAEPAAPAAPEPAKPAAPAAPEKPDAKPKPTAAKPHKASEMSRKAYVRALAAEIRRHTPKTSKASPGSVTVAFTVGASGKVVSHSVKHSSNPEVAALAGKILASIHTPPPPGGKFTAIQEFRFR